MDHLALRTLFAKFGIGASTSAAAMGSTIARAGQPNSDHGFPDGSKGEPTACLGWTFAKQLRPDRIVVLGTSGSMWDFLADQAGIVDQSDVKMLSAWQPLADSVRDSAVEEKLLS